MIAKIAGIAKIIGHGFARMGTDLSL